VPTLEYLRQFSPTFICLCGFLLKLVSLYIHSGNNLQQPLTASMTLLQAGLYIDFWLSLMAFLGLSEKVYQFEQYISLTQSPVALIGI